MESPEVRLARIEEGLVSLHGKTAERHQEVMKALRPLVEKVDKHHLAIALMRRDRKWIYGILAVVGSGLGYVVKSLLSS